ncbi:MAG: NifU family protein [Bacillales bacterium]|nr:NifU family protein [Bacillales bacterium]
MSSSFYPKSFKNETKIIDFFHHSHYNIRRKESIHMSDQAMKEQVQEVLDKLRPFLLRDGGDCQLMDVEDGIVKLRLLGACGSCPSSTITLKAGIERALLEEVPGIVEVEQVF